MVFGFWLGGGVRTVVKVREERLCGEQHEVDVVVDVPPRQEPAPNCTFKHFLNSDLTK